VPTGAAQQGVMPSKQPPIACFRATVQTTLAASVLPILFLVGLGWDWDPTDYTISTEGLFATVMAALLPIAAAAMIFPAVGWAMHRAGVLNRLSFALCILGVFVLVAFAAAAVIAQLLHMPPTNSANLRVVWNLGITFLSFLMVLGFPFCMLWLRQSRVPHNHVLQRTAASGRR
jgi:hypothetical protein